MGGKCIVTLTGWTHRLHTNTKRKCVSILCIPETSLTDACSSSINEQSRRKGVKSVEVGGENDARGHVPPVKDTQKKSQSIPEHSITNFNGDGGEHSQAEKRRVEGHRAPKELHQES